jgi:hypothetical protein
LQCFSQSGLCLAIGILIGTVDDRTLGSFLSLGSRQAIAESRQRHNFLMFSSFNTDPSKRHGLPCDDNFPDIGLDAGNTRLSRGAVWTARSSCGRFDEWANGNGGRCLAKVASMGLSAFRHVSAPAAFVPPCMENDGID